MSITTHTHSSIGLFSELGELVESRWQKQNYDESLFPEIAAGALSELKLAERVDPWDIIRWVHDTPDLPPQMDVEANFGDPPITIYVGSEFFIDIYFWLDGTTSIHQHAFSGAFQVLLGSSVHSSYRFEKQREINPHFMTGEISLNEVSLLSRGDIKEINPGPQYIHSLFTRTSFCDHHHTEYKTPTAACSFAIKNLSSLTTFFNDASLKRKLQRWSFCCE